MSQILEILEQFLNIQKLTLLEKRISQETNEKRKNYEKLILQQSKNLYQNEKLAQEKEKYEKAILKAREKHEPDVKKKYELSTWFIKAINESKPNTGTHVAKFTNPKIKNVSPIIFSGKLEMDGYIKSGNVISEEKIDVSGNSATNTIIFELYLFLTQKFNENQKIVDLFEANHVELITFISGFGIDYELAKKKCLEVFLDGRTVYYSHELLKQIYFPIFIDEDYHLLSVLTPSCLLFEVKRRIDLFKQRINENDGRALKKDNKFYKTSFDKMYNLTEIGFSHDEFTKMGNFSYLNVKNEGIAYLIPSLPPEFKQRQIRWPTYNFFANTLWIGDFKESFKSLHGLMKSSVSKKEKIDNILKYIIDKVLRIAFQVRASGIGWSKTEYYKNLPLPQRIWLDDSYMKERENIEMWLYAICSAFSRWIIQAYEKTLKKEHIKLGSAELQHIRDFVDDAVKHDKEFFK